MILFKNCRLIPELTEGFNFEAGSLADIWVSDNWVIESIEPAGATNAADAQVAQLKTAIDSQQLADAIAAEFVLDRFGF